jgi:hypothetical protein
MTDRHALDDQVTLIVQLAREHRANRRTPWPGVPVSRLPRSSRLAVNEAVSRGLVVVQDVPRVRHGDPTRFVVAIGKEISDGEVMK